MVKLRKINTLLKQLGLLLLAGSILLAASSLPHSAGASSPSELRNRIDRLETEIDTNRERIHNLDEQAGTLQEAIDEFDLQLAVINQEIEVIQLQLDDIRLQLEATRTELERQKSILRQSLREHYTFGEVRTIELLVESDSFADFFDQKEYLDRVRSNVQESATKIAELEQQLEEQEAEQQRLLNEQQAKKAEIEANRAAKQRLLDETRGEEALYQARLASLNRQRAAADAELDRYIQGLLDSGVSLGPIGEGEYIGGVGNTGYSSGPHLHFAIQRDGVAYDPEAIMDQKGWVWPVPGHTHKSQGYNDGHRAIDIPAPIGTPIVSTGDGEIIHKGCLHTGTIYSTYAVLIKHSGGWVSRYIHMNPPSGNPAYDACRANTYY